MGYLSAIEYSLAYKEKMDLNHKTLYFKRYEVYNIAYNKTMDETALQHYINNKR